MSKLLAKEDIKSEVMFDILNSIREILDNEEEQEELKIKYLRKPMIKLKENWLEQEKNL